MKDFCEKLKIEGVRASPHTLRHTFALNYVRQGGDLFALQKMQGPTTLAMTRPYTELQTEDLQIAHVKVSLLNHLRGSAFLVILNHVAIKTANFTLLDFRFNCLNAKRTVHHIRHCINLLPSYVIEGQNDWIGHAAIQTRLIV